MKKTIITLSVITSLLLVSCEKLEKHESQKQKEVLQSNIIGISNPNIEVNTLKEESVEGIENYHEKLFIFHRSSTVGSDLIYADYLDSPGGPWNTLGEIPGKTEGNVNGNGTTGVEACQFNGSVYTFYRGSSSSNYQIYSTFSNNALVWSQSVSLPSAYGTDAKMGVVEFNSKMYIFYKSVNSTVLKYGYTTDGVSWNYVGTIPNESVISNAVDAVVFNNAIYVFHGSNNLQIKYAKSTNGISWTNHTIDLSSRYGVNNDLSGVEAVSYYNKIYVFFYRKNNEPYSEEFPQNHEIGYVKTNFGGPDNGWELSDYVSPYDPGGSNLVTIKYINYHSRRLTERPISATVDGDKLVVTHRTGSGQIMVDNLFQVWQSAPWYYWQDSWNYNVQNPSDPSFGGTTGFTTLESPEIIKLQLPQIQNIALSASVSASSTYQGYSKHRVNDGSTSTGHGGANSWTHDRFNGMGGELPEWVTLDFGATKTYSSIRIYTDASYPISSYLIQSSSNAGGPWALVASKSGNGSAVITHNFPTTSSRYLRIWCQSGPPHQSDWARLNEIQVFGN